MTLEALKRSGHIIFECISGSKAYGLDTPSSDTDIRGVYVLPEELYYSLDYVGQVNNDSNDIVYYEIRKFLELCLNNNPNILELLNVPIDCILYKHPIFEKVKMDMFLSKKCEVSFGNYAFTQIKKARGLEKKIVNPMEKERKSLLDFCYVLKGAQTQGLKQFLLDNDLDQENCGLSKVAHMKSCFNVFYSKEINYKGIVKNTSSNDVSLSSIPKGESSITMLFFNKDGYSIYCKKYKEYWDWVAKRSEDRYATTVAHGKKYDSKNMMHTFRLLHMAKEIAEEGCINVYRNDREYLLNIKEGKYEYDDLVQKAEDLKAELSDLFVNSELPMKADKNKVNELLVAIRKEYYANRKQLK